MKNADKMILLLKNFNNTYTSHEEIFDCFCELFAVDDRLPMIINKKDYKNVGGTVIFRAYNSKMKEFSLYKDQFLTGKYQRFSRSVLGKGMCFSDDKSVIREYSSLMGKVIGANIIECKLDKNARLAEQAQLINEFNNRHVELMKRIQQHLNCEEEIANTLLKIASEEYNHMMRAVLCGYDGLYAQYDDGRNIFVIYNRSCLSVPKRERTKNV